ncbi:hypothetical protein [Nocardia brasiliensis]|uniref:Uncharacterized protein n=1 Tax=Nocardia brasiliensis (strain ATCC 700358 / HUJEG-1) TaxID=1133849 RepID=K0FB55_NOCB7|nr:hypothetical protein [Nocardia brasiliensis]AFU04681.1 hypothetical protein O3I_033660 [Nocardia brasiliensis ATCC 700358]OCF88339.1 hypothetical protein AW168_21880 [Nocardia brasiliensis]
MTFGDDFDPGRLQELIVEMGGQLDTTWTAWLQRDNSWVAVDIHPFVRRLPANAPRQEAAAYNELHALLGSPPRHRATLHSPATTAAEWLAAEIVLEAARHWPLLLYGYDEERITIEQFERRVARRTHGLFWSQLSCPESGNGGG